MRYIRHAMLEFFRWLLSVVIPVKKGKILFQSFPDYSDNARAFSDYLIEHTEYNIYWSVSDATKYPNTDRITFLEKDGGGTLRGKLIFIYHTVSSQFLFSTHAAFLFANKYKQKYICLWHGTPLKRIAYLQNPENKNYLSNTTGILCSSKYFIPITARCFGWSEDRIIPIGLPRNDWMFQKTDALERLGIKLKKDEKLIIYLPTFRQTADNVYDSNLDTFSSDILDLKNENNINKLNDFLTNHHLRMIVKPHPLDKNQLEYRSVGQISIIPQNVLIKYDIQLYQLLYFTDALLTDFSSVYADFLMLDRPIGFILTDLSEYNNNRGFTFENPLEFMPGMKIYSEEDFLSFCKDLYSGNDRYKSERDRLRYIYNDHNDGKCCERLVKYLSL